jgi:hypothetical protein
MIWLVITAHLEVAQDGGARVADVALIVGVHLQQAVCALDDLQRRHHARGLERHVGHPVDGDPGRDLDEQRGLARHRQEAARGFSHEAGQLRLESIQECVTAENRAGHAQTLQAGWDAFKRRAAETPRCPDAPIMRRDR